MSYGIYLIILLPFTLIGSIMSYFITYSEYLHHYKTKKEPRKLAWQAAFFSFIFLSIISVFIIYMLLNYIEK